MVPLLELPQGGEWIVILVVVVLLFGAQKLPELTRNTARALVEFKKVTASEDGEETGADAADPGTRRPSS
jgi:sec-independent protein translocase protein TatA